MTNLIYVKIFYTQSCASFRCIGKQQLKLLLLLPMHPLELFTVDILVHWPKTNFINQFIGLLTDRLLKVNKGYCKNLKRLPHPQPRSTSVGWKNFIGSSEMIRITVANLRRGVSSQFAVNSSWNRYQLQSTTTRVACKQKDLKHRLFFAVELHSRALTRFKKLFRTADAHIQPPCICIVCVDSG